MPLGQAHDTATMLEDAIRRELGSDAEVESHIEPQPERLLEGHEAEPKLADSVTASLLELARPPQAPVATSTSIRMRHNDEGMFLHYHCRCEPDRQVEHVHDDIDRIEASLKEAIPISAGSSPMPNRSASRQDPL